MAKNIKPYEITVDSELNSEIAKGLNLLPVMPEIVAVIQSSIDENFRVGGRFGTDNEYGGGSNKWPAIKHRSGIPLTDTGDLKNRVEVTFSGTNVYISSPRVDFPTHNFGDKRDGKVWPARPIAVIQNEDLEEIEFIIESHISGMLK